MNVSDGGYKRDRESLPVGYELQGYRIERVLGRGGFGITYLASEAKLERQVAIKEFLPAEFAYRENDHTVIPVSKEAGEIYSWGLTRFLDEARTLAKFLHPNIVHVNSLLEQNNTAYMVMKFEEGDSLSSVFEKGQMRDQQSLLNIVLPILDGLSQVHEAGFIHRDIKPANIYIRKDGSPVLLDFGSARQMVSGQTSTMTRLISQSYTPFEQYGNVDGKQGPWTDIYSLGATLYYGISGQLPSDAMVRSSSIHDRGADCVQSLTSLTSLPFDYSTEFLKAVDWALAFRPDDRPQSGQAWMQALTKGHDDVPHTIHLQRGWEDEDDLTRIMPAEVYSEKVTSRRLFEEGAAVSSSRSQEGSLGTQLLDTSRAAGSSSELRSDESDLADLSFDREPVESQRAHSTRSEPVKRPRRKKRPRSAVPALSAVLLMVLGAGGFWYYSTVLKPQMEIDTQVDGLLREGRSLAAEKRFLEADGKDALEAYAKVLELQPENADAAQGVKRATTITNAQVESLIQNNQFAEAEALVALMMSRGFDSSTTDALSKRISVATVALENKTEKDRAIGAAEELIASGQVFSDDAAGAMEVLTSLLDKYPDDAQVQMALQSAFNFAFERVDDALANSRLGDSAEMLSELRIYGADDLAVQRREEELRGLATPPTKEPARPSSVAVSQAPSNTPASSPRASGRAVVEQAAVPAAPQVRQRLSAEERAEAQRRSLQAMFSSIDESPAASPSEDRAATAARNTRDMPAQRESTPTSSLQAARNKSIKELIGEFNAVKYSAETLDLRSLTSSSAMSSSTFRQLNDLATQFRSLNVEMTGVDIFEERGMATAQLTIRGGAPRSGGANTTITPNLNYSLVMRKTTQGWGQVNW